MFFNVHHEFFYSPEVDHEIASTHSQRENRSQYPYTKEDPICVLSNRLYPLNC